MKERAPPQQLNASIIEAIRALHELFYVEVPPYDCIRIQQIEETLTLRSSF